MSLFGDEFITIPLYYTYKDTKYGGKRLIILEDEVATKALESEDEEKQKIKILNTRWKQLTWKEQNELVGKAEKTNPTTGMPDLDWPLYQDTRVKYCLKSWDYKENARDPEPVPVTPETIDKLQSSVVKALLDKFDSITSVEKEELEK